MKSSISHNDFDKKMNRDRVVDGVVFAILFFVAMAITFRLFYLQATEQGNSFPSDMKAYILEIQGLNDTYSFPYPIIFWVGRLADLFVTPECAMAVATAFLNGLAMLIMKWEMNSRLLITVREGLDKRANGRFTWAAGIFLSLISLSLFFISMMLLPGNLWLPGMRHKCIGVFSSNPFHNATYMAARPFAILSFFLFCDLLDRYEKEKDFPGKKEDWKSCLLFSLCLLLSTMAKPSFTIILVGAAGLNMLFVWAVGKFQRWKPTILLGLCFVPTFLALLYQYSGVFVSKEETVEAGIGFCLGDVWHLYCSFVPSALILGAGFPILVWILHFKDFKKNMPFRFSLELYWMSFVMAYFLYEKGFRKNDFNFAWGYMYGIFFAFVGALVLLIHATSENMKSTPSEKEKKGIWKWILLCLEWCVYLAHLVSGLIYFGWLSRGASYF